ncbi:MAG: imidazolonepropionase [Gammaproteobacteria bacterium]|nr:imidazolonepropionase [Gammaproteobacteria bacterium]
MQRLLTNCRVATMRSGNPYGLLEDAAVAIRDGRIAWVGPAADRAHDPTEEQVDLCGGLVTPGLIDCHTHLVYAGNRAEEWALRLEGASYEEIARRGGGIVSTVSATRAATHLQLLEATRTRLDVLLAEGVTTVEVKSGYGLDLETELRMLRVARELGEAPHVDVVATFLGAHALPPEYRERRADYVRMMIDEVLPAVANEGLADAVDAYCEGIAFTTDEVRSVFESAQARGLPLRLHAEQLSNCQGAAMAAGMGALSCDHLEYLDEAGVEAMAAAGTVAVLVPGAWYYLRETQEPPVDALRSANVPIAVSTDHNPGTSPVLSILAAMNMGCVLFGLSPEEALRGATANAARALGFDDRGVIEPGKLADLAVWDVQSPAELSYALGHNPCRRVFKAGVPRNGG